MPRGRRRIPGIAEDAVDVLVQSNAFRQVFDLLQHQHCLECPFHPQVCTVHFVQYGDCKHAVGDGEQERDHEPDQPQDAAVERALI